MSTTTAEDMNKPQEKLENLEDFSSVGENGGKDHTEDTVTLHTVQESIAALHTKLDRITAGHEKSVLDIQQNYGTIVSLKAECAGLKKENEQLREELALVKSAVIHQSKDIMILKQDCTDLRTRSMGYNVLVHGLPEEKGEACRDKLKALLSQHEYAKAYYIDVAHRVGSSVSKSDPPRPIVARLARQSQADEILKFASKKKDLKITPQFPAEVRERRRQLGEIAEAARKKGTDVKTKIVTDALYINNEKYRDMLPTPDSNEMLHLTADDRSEAVKSFPSVASKSENGSRFTVRAVKVNSIEQCRRLYRMLLLNPDNMAANHNTAIFRLTTPPSDGYTDDGEFGMGRTIRNYLQERDVQNVVVFVTRHYGGVHLGPKRFSIVKSLVKDVIDKLT